MGTKVYHLAQAVKLKQLANECRRLAKIAGDDVAERFYRERAYEYQALADEEEKLARCAL